MALTQIIGSGISGTTINSNGIVIPKGVIMQVNATNTDQAVGASNTKIQWENVIIDTISGWDSTNHRYTPSVAGYYLVGGVLRLRMDTTNQFANIQVKKNGSDAIANVIEAQYNFNSDIINNSCLPSGSGLMLLNGSSDYIEMWIQGDEAMTAHDSSTQGSLFFATLVHAT